MFDNIIKLIETIGNLEPLNMALMVAALAIVGAVIIVVSR